MMARRRRRILRRILACVAPLASASALVACSDSPTESIDPSLSALTASLVVSDATFLTSGGATQGTPEVTWISLPPGTLPGMVSVRMRNLSTAGPQTDLIPVVDGGFDPVFVLAAESDVLELAFGDANGVIHVARVPVPRRRPPSIVRTSPLKGRTDVALDTRPLIVFTEPIDPATLTDQSIRLISAGGSVEGSIVVPAQQPWLVVFEPAIALNAGTEYALEITTRIRDLQGEALEEPATVTFTTVTAASVGHVEISNRTTGGAYDPDGYQLFIDGLASSVVDLNERILFEFREGLHTIELRDVAANCTVVGGPAKNITVQASVTDSLAFQVECTAPPELARMRIVFASGPAGRMTLVGADIVTMNADGSDRVRLTSGYVDWAPAVSPDAKRIAFQRQQIDGATSLASAIHVMNADGTGESLLVDAPSYGPDWSPDGRRIVFIRGPGIWGGFIHVVSADGTDLTALSQPGAFPSPEEGWSVWSPDGSRIAFTRAELLQTGARLSLWTMSADGSGASQLTPAGLSDAWGPFGSEWAPDGSQIAFSKGDGLTTGTTIYRINSDGTGVTPILQTPLSLHADQWSRDGEWLLLSGTVPRGTPGRQCIYLYDIPRATLYRLTADDASSFTPFFWPQPAPRPGN